MHPLAAPGALWVLSRAGKVSRPPAGGRNLPQETGFLRRAMERSLLSFFCFAGGFASAEATRGLSGRPLDPFGAHLLKRMGATKNRFLVGGKEKSFTFFFRFLGDFASAEATKGLSDRPLETFGPFAAKGWRKKQIPYERQGKRSSLLFPVSQGISHLRVRPGGFPLAPWTPSGMLLIGEIQKYLTAHTRVRYFCIFPLFLPPNGRTVPAENVILPPHQGHESLSLR